MMGGMGRKGEELNDEKRSRGEDDRRNESAKRPRPSPQESCKVSGDSRRLQDRTWRRQGKDTDYHDQADTTATRIVPPTPSSLTEARAPAAPQCMRYIQEQDVARQGARPPPTPTTPHSYPTANTTYFNYRGVYGYNNAWPATTAPSPIRGSNHHERDDDENQGYIALVIYVLPMHL